MTAAGRSCRRYATSLVTRVDHDFTRQRCADLLTLINLADMLDLLRSQARLHALERKALGFDQGVPTRRRRK